MKTNPIPTVLPVHFGISGFPHRSTLSVYLKSNAPAGCTKSYFLSIVEENPNIWSVWLVVEEV